MIQNNEKEIIEVLTRLEEKVDNIASQVKSNNIARLDSETVAILTAAAYNTFGRAINIKNIRLTNSDSNCCNRKKYYNVVAI